MKSYNNDNEYKVSFSSRMSEALKAELMVEAEELGMTTSSYVEKLLENHDRADSYAFRTIEAQKAEIEELNTELQKAHNRIELLRANAEHKARLVAICRTIGLTKFDEAAVGQVERNYQKLESAYPGRNRFEILAAALDRAVESQDSFFAQTLGGFWKE